MESFEYIGFIAGLFIAISVLPQVIKSWRTKSTKDIALLWSILNSVGQSLWLVYGLAVHSLSLVIMTSITLLFNLSMFFLKLKYG